MVEKRSGQLFSEEFAPCTSYEPLDGLNKVARAISVVLAAQLTPKFLIVAFP